MDVATDVTANPPALVEYARLPNLDEWPAQGERATYNLSGEKDEDGNVVIFIQGVAFLWACFQEPLKAGQTATMVFDNVPGPWQLGGCATEWNATTGVPQVGEAIISLIAMGRGIGTGSVVCRNTHNADHHAAVGLIIILP